MPSAAGMALRMPDSSEFRNEIESGRKKPSLLLCRFGASCENVVLVFKRSFAAGVEVC